MIYKLVFLAFILATPVFGQDVKPTNNGGEVATGNWSRIGSPVEGNRGFTLYGRGVRINNAGAYELWVKIVPANPSAFIKRYSLPKNTEYAQQYATIDCAKKLLLLEKTAAYDSGNKVIDGNTSSLTPSSKKDLVKPGSIGDVLFRSVCEDPSTLQKTQIQN